MGHTVDVITTAYVESNTRCHNSCEYMQISIVRYTDPKTGSLKQAEAHCSLYDCTLSWDRRYNSNGYKRCTSCRKGEQP